MIEFTDHKQHVDYVLRSAALLVKLKLIKGANQQLLPKKQRAVPKLACSVSNQSFGIAEASKDGDNDNSLLLGIGKAVDDSYVSY